MRYPNSDHVEVLEVLRGLEALLASREHLRADESARGRCMRVTLVITASRGPARGTPMPAPLAAVLAGSDVGNEIMPHLRRL